MRRRARIAPFRPDPPKLDPLTLLKALLIPPNGLLLAAVVALMLRRRAPRAAGGVLAVCVIGLYALSTPLISTWALGSLQPAYVDPAAQRGVQAIVLLAGGTRDHAVEYGGADTVNALSLIRLRYAAKLQRMTQLPLLVSGGSVRDDTLAESEQIRTVLTDEIGIPVRWTETRSVDTYTNAVESAKLLKAAGIDRVFLVTHAWHIPRARLAFEHAGLHVIPAPTDYVTPDWPELGDFLPRPSALVNSYYFFHEIIGYAAYVLRARW